MEKKPQQALLQDSQAAVLVLTTWPSDTDPAALTLPLVEEGLAACVSVLAEMESVYRWQGQVCRDRERQIVIKTTPGRLESLVARLGEIHPYEVPELLVVPVAAGGSAYLEWMATCTLPR